MIIREDDKTLEDKNVCKRVTYQFGESLVYEEVHTNSKMHLRLIEQSSGSYMSLDTESTTDDDSNVLPSMMEK